MSALVLYSLSIGAAAALAAQLLDLALANIGGARRWPWLAAIFVTLLLPPLAMWFAKPVALIYDSRMMPTQLVETQTGEPRAIGKLPAMRASTVAGGAALDDFLGFAWLASSGVTLVWLGAGARRLARRARDWESTKLDEAPISIARDLGPAVYGWRSPRIVFPAWLLAAPAATQRLALAHERAHLAARDPQLLAFATLLMALQPWNLALLWMLRRLRFAMEVDCDARVLRGGADAAEYGDALLFVSERQSRAPLAALALIERPSQLEKRINIMFGSNYRPALAAGLVALALTCVVGAAQIDAPQRIEHLALKPPPGGPDFKMGPIFEREFERRWPGIFDSNAEGSNVVIALVNPDLTVTKAARVTSTEKPDTVGEDNGMFRLIGIAPEDAAYMAIMGMQSPTHPERKTMVLYTELKTPGQPFVSKVFEDTRAIDREIARHVFGDALRNGVPAGARLWVLFDRSGRVLRNGIEASLPAHMDEFIGARFPGVKIAESTWSPLVDEQNSPVKDAAGHDVQLDSVWLAADSSLPKN